MKSCYALILLIFSVSVHALDILSGEWVQGAMLIGKTQPGNTLRFLEREVKVNNEGIFVVGIGRDAPEKMTILEISPSGETSSHRVTVKQRTYNEQRIEGVPKRTVQVPEDQLPRIRQEVKMTKVARKTNSNRQDFQQNFVWPSKGIITGIYGSRRVYNGQPRRPHYGIDIAAPKGSLVLAPAGGQVTLVHEDMYFSGGTLIVDHGHGVSSSFIHLSDILVKVGDVVAQGEPIAKVGATGRATGPHLDWRMNWFEQRLDPQLLMNGLPEKFK